MGEILTNLKVKDLKKYLCNRYPYLMIDVAEEIIPGVSARGYKNLTANEWYFPVHFPEEPTMPGMIQMEALLQMLSLTVLTLDGNACAPIVGIEADKVRIRKKAVPGCRLDIEAKLISIDETGIVTGSAIGRIADEEVCSAVFKFNVVHR
jgi:3-hydroxyacyl-[acyl-carrier-protein] dehydratase